jgi:hypothetical protein
MFLAHLKQMPKIGDFPPMDIKIAGGLFLQKEHNEHNIKYAPYRLFVSPKICLIHFLDLLYKPKIKKKQDYLKLVYLFVVAHPFQKINAIVSNHE